MTTDRMRYSMIWLVVFVIVIAATGCVRRGMNADSMSMRYRSPMDIVISPDGDRAYVAEHTGRSVVEIDLERAVVLRRLSLPVQPTSLAFSPDGGMIYVTGGVVEGRVFAVDAGNFSIVGDYSAGHSPSHVSVSPDGATLYVSNRFDNTLSAVDVGRETETVVSSMLREPMASVVTPDGRFVFVANHLPTGDRISEYITDGGILMIGSYISTGAYGPGREDYATSSVILVYEPEYMRLAEMIVLPRGSTDLRGLCMSPDGRYVYAVHVHARYHLPTTQLERGWVATNALSVIDVRKKELVVTLPLDDPDHGAANPWDVMCSPDGAQLYVSHAGTQEISVIDRTALHGRIDDVVAGKNVMSSSTVGDIQNDLSFLSGIRKRVVLPGNGARGLAAGDSGVVVAEYFSDTVSILSDGGECRSVKLGSPAEMSAERFGEMMFHDAEVCFQGWLSCVTCHPDGRMDGLNWDLLNDGVGNPKSTKSLLYSHRTPPVMLAGIRPDAETAVRAGLQYIQFTAVDEDVADAMDAYLKALEPVPSPKLNGGKLTGEARHGREVFVRAGCAECHSGPLYTDHKLWDVGTGFGPDRGVAYDTPTLVEIWRTSPYLSDGRADTMDDMLIQYNRGDMHGEISGLSTNDFNCLIEYIMSL